jgi:hypothetical protein
LSTALVVKLPPRLPVWQNLPNKIGPQGLDVHLMLFQRVTVLARSLDVSDLVDWLPGVEDRPADLGAPQGVVGGLLAANDVQLTQGALYANRMFCHVRPERLDLEDAASWFQGALGERHRRRTKAHTVRSGGRDLRQRPVHPRTGRGRHLPNRSYAPGESLRSLPRPGLPPLGGANISGADFAIAFVDEIEKPAHHQTRFTLGY